MRADEPQADSSQPAHEGLEFATRGRVHRLKQAAGWAVLFGPPFVGLVALAVRHWRASAAWQLAIVAGAPYLMLIVPLGLIVAVALRRWWVAVATGLVATVCAFTQFPLYVADTWSVTEPRVTVMTQNADLGRARADDVVRAVRSHDVDALVVTELTSSLRVRLRTAGLDEELRFTALEPKPGARGTGIWSRSPMEQVRSIPGFSCAVVTAQIDIDWGYGPEPVRLIGLHLIGPTWDAAGWRRDARRLPDALRPFGTGWPTIIAGDFNATPDSPWLRDALESGFANAADSSGAGLVRTYPTDYPVLAIDHVLTSKLIAQSVERVRVAGTDHRGVVATLAFPVS